MKLSLKRANLVVHSAVAPNEKKETVEAKEKKLMQRFLEQQMDNSPQLEYRFTLGTPVLVWTGGTAQEKESEEGTVCRIHYLRVYPKDGGSSIGVAPYQVLLGRWNPIDLLPGSSECLKRAGCMCKTCINAVCVLEDKDSHVRWRGAEN